MTHDQEVKYRAFISYSHADKKWARWLHNQLESYRVPRHLESLKAGTTGTLARLTPIFRDQDELASSADLSSRINEALVRSDNLVVVCSPRAARSRWVNEEIIAFKRLGRSDRIFCLIVDGDPGAVGRDDDCFPPALRETYDAHGALVGPGAEPIAADIRKHADGTVLALQKILAGLLDVGLDQLRRREYQRRQRRMLAITGASVAATVVTAVLALNAVQARDEADRRRQQAEELLGFMVGDFRASLTPLGRLDLLENVGAQAMDYFATVDVSDLSDEELLRQAQVLMQLGEIQVDQNNFALALASFEDAYARSSRLAANAPNDLQRLFNRGQIEYWLGFVSWRNGAAADAEQWWTRYLESSQQLVTQEPGNDTWMREVGYAYQNLAVLAEDQGQLERAEDGYNYLLEVLQDIQMRNQDPAIALEVSNTISFLGNLAMERGALLAAREQYQRAVAVLDTLMQQDPGNALVHEDLAVAAFRVAAVDVMTGNVEQGQAGADRSIQLLNELIERDPSNTNLQRLRTSGEAVKASTLIASGNLEAATPLLASSITTLGSILAAGATDLGIRQYLGRAYFWQARRDLSAGQPAAAMQAALLALEHMRVLENSARRLNTERVALLANVYLLLAQLQQAGAELPPDSAPLQSAGTVLQDRISTSNATELLAAWEQYLALSGRTEEAAVMQQKLQSQGYVSLF